MKTWLACVIVVAAAVLCCAPAESQVLTNSLPAGFTAADYASLVFSAPQVVQGLDHFNNVKFTANVSWDMSTVGANTFYWYRLSAVSFATSSDMINRVTLNVDVNAVNSIGPVLQYGQYENAGVGTTSLVANGPSSTPFKLSWDSTPGGDGLAAGQTIDLWVAATDPIGSPASLQIINSGVTVAAVPAPTPEPLSLILSGLGISTVAWMRRKR